MRSWRTRLGQPGRPGARGARGRSRRCDTHARERQTFGLERPPRRPRRERTRLAFRTPDGGPVLRCTAERLAEIEAALGGGRADPPLALPDELRTASGRDAALAELLRARLGCLEIGDRGNALPPISGSFGGRPRGRARRSRGGGLRATNGRFTQMPLPSNGAENRSLLAKIQRLQERSSTARDRACIPFGVRPRPASNGSASSPTTGARATRRSQAAVGELEGFAAPAAVWESEILPARIVIFTPGSARAAPPYQPWPRERMLGASGPRDLTAFVRADPIDRDRSRLPSGTIANFAVVPRTAHDRMAKLGTDSCMFTDSKAPQGHSG